MTEYQDTTINFGPVDATPEEAGFDPANINRLDSYFKKLMGKGTLQGAGYLLSKNGKIFAYRSMGKLTFKETSRDFHPEAIRRIASITKVFTAVSVLQLIEKGELRLDQTVASIIEEFNNQMFGKINISHLLTHTSGIAPQGGYYLEPYPVDWDMVYNSGNWIKEVLRGKIYNKPGEEWAYSNYGFMILGEIISRVSGVPFEEYVIENIVMPMGMNHTFFKVPSDLRDQVCIAEEWEEQRINNPGDRTGKPPQAAGGLFSTMFDMWKFGMMFLNHGTFNGNKILGRKTIEAMTRPQVKSIKAYHWADEKLVTYGLGVGLYINNEFLSPETFGHEGAGYSAWFIDPKEQFIAMYIVPTKLGWIPEGVITPRNIIWSGIR